MEVQHLADGGVSCGGWSTHTVEELSLCVLDRLPVPAEPILDVVRQVCAPFLSFKQGQVGDLAASLQFEIPVPWEVCLCPGPSASPDDPVAERGLFDNVVSARAFPGHPGHCCQCLSVFVGFSRFKKKTKNIFLLI